MLPVFPGWLCGECTEASPWVPHYNCLVRSEPYQRQPIVHYCSISWWLSLNYASWDHGMPNSHWLGRGHFAVDSELLLIACRLRFLGGCMPLWCGTHALFGCPPKKKLAAFGFTWFQLALMLCHRINASWIIATYHLQVHTLQNGLMVIITSWCCWWWPWPSSIPHYLASNMTNHHVQPTCSHERQKRFFSVGLL